MRKVVICALALNVLSSCFLHEQGWETRLGNLKVSGLYHRKVKFLLKISDRAWWLEVQVLKHQGKSSRNRKDNGPKDMEVDHFGVVHSNLLSKACQPKDVSTEVELPVVKIMRRECQIKSFDGLGPCPYVCRMIRFSEPNTSEVELLEDDLQAESRGFSSEASFKPSFKGKLTRA